MLLAKFKSETNWNRISDTINLYVQRSVDKNIIFLSTLGIASLCSEYNEYSMLCW